MRASIGSLAAVALAALLVPADARADSHSPAAPTAEALSAEIQAIKREYEARIQALEDRLSAMREEPEAAAPASGGRAGPAPDNTFNPAIGVTLDGRYTRFSSDHSEIPGFPLGHEAERGAEGFSLGHSEVVVSSSIDDKFYGGLTLGLDAHPGEAAQVELEEAFVQTSPGAGLPEGMRIKAGRALWTFGYLNELHAHADDFADRPLPYRAFLDNAYNDDGVEVSMVLPTDVYSEVGAGLFRGDDLPFGGAGGATARSLYGRIGGDIGRDIAWRLGGYMLQGKSSDRGGGHTAHAHNGHNGDGHDDHDDDEHGEDMHDEDHHDDDEHAEDDHFDDDHAAFFTGGLFTGKTRLHGIDFRVTMAPTGNARESELILQGEYFWRRENGTYVLAEETAEADGDEHHEEDEEHHGELATDSVARGWYVQAVYKFARNWRVGARYARLSPPGDAEIEQDPHAVGVMADWTNSEFGRVRLQYNREAFAEGETDSQLMLQYVMSLGAHAAHSF